MRSLDKIAEKFNYLVRNIDGEDCLYKEYGNCWIEISGFWNRRKYKDILIKKWVKPTDGGGSVCNFTFYNIQTIDELGIALKENHTILSTPINMTRKQLISFQMFFYTDTGSFDSAVIINDEMKSAKFTQLEDGYVLIRSSNDGKVSYKVLKPLGK